MGFFQLSASCASGSLFILLADRYAERKTVADGSRLCAMGLILFFAHGLVFLFACWIGVALLLARRERRARAWKGILAYIPLGVLSVVYAAISHGREAALPNGPDAVIWREWELRLNFISHIFCSTPYDLNVAIFVLIAGVFMLWAPRLLKSSFNRTRYQAIIPMAVLALVWIAAPFYALKTTFIYTRFALFILPFYALMFCRPARRKTISANEILEARVVQWVLAAICWVLLAGQTERLVAFARESRDFDVVRLAVEPRHRALALILDNDSPAARSHVAYHHYPVWYQAENGGLVDFNFAWFTPQIVRFRSDQLPAIRPFWRPEDFSWTEHKGWLYRYFFIRHTQPIPETFFKNTQCEVALLKSAGSWSVYESKRCGQ